jgi:hypothetical protein
MGYVREKNGDLAMGVGLMQLGCQSYIFQVDAPDETFSTPISDLELRLFGTPRHLMIAGRTLISAPGE